MKTISSFKHLFVLATALVVSFAACSSVTNEVESITDEDIAVAAEVMGSSLSDDESGIISSMYDAFSDVDNSGISYGNTFAKSQDNDDRNHGRGFERNFSHSYDSTTGEHTLSYSRLVERGEFYKSLEVNQTIIYTDLDGEFIARPKAERSNIEAISFTGSKVGEHEGPVRSSNFTRSNEFDMSGIHETSSILSFEGTHTGSGNASISTDTLQAERTYSVDISWENVTVNKDTVEAYGSLENAVSGTLNYSITMNKTVNGVPEETLVEGTIDLAEDGSALMRFKNLPRTVKFALKDGDKSEDNRRGE